jgi:hypothetical protein
MVNAAAYTAAAERDGVRAFAVNAGGRSVPVAMGKPRQSTRQKARILPALLSLMKREKMPPLQRPRRDRMARSFSGDRRD